MIYFVTTFKHITTGWVYKVENKYTDIDSALKSFYALCGNNVDAEGVDSYTCILEDAMGNQVEKVAWVKQELSPEE